MKLIQLYLRAFALLAPETRLAWLLALGNLVLAAAQFAEPVLFGHIVDALTGSGGRNAAESWGALAPLAAAWVGFGLFIIACGALIALYAGRLSHRRRQAVLTDFFQHVLQLPLRDRDDTRSDRQMEVMLAGTDILWALWLAFFREHLAGVLSLIVLLPLTLLLNWRLALVVIVLALAFAFLSALVTRKTKSLQAEVEGHHVDLAARVSDALGNVALVQSYTRVDIEVARLRTVTTRLLDAQMPVLSWWALATVLTRSATMVTMLTLLLFGIWFLFERQASVGEIVSFMFIAALVMGRLEQAVGFADATLKDLPRLRQFFDVFDTAPAVRDRADAFDAGRMHGLVEFKDVSFSSDGKRAAVADVTFTALPGQTIALVGAAGAGKSAALALLHRDFDPQSGVVAIDGMDIRGVVLSALRRNIGVALRDALFNRSIAENLRVGKPDATEDELRAACERAQVMDLIAAKSEGFEASVGERGDLLSADERQRLSIARVFLTDPPILILDEATSARDAVTEAKVQATLDEAMKGRTTFVIAHRLSTLRNAQRILVFDNGRIIENGTFDELQRLDGQFVALTRSQFMGAPAADAATKPD